MARPSNILMTVTIDTRRFEAVLTRALHAVWEWEWRFLTGERWHRLGGVK